PAKTLLCQIHVFPNYPSQYPIPGSAPAMSRFTIHFFAFFARVRAEMNLFQSHEPAIGGSSREPKRHRTKLSGRPDATVRNQRASRAQFYRQVQLSSSPDAVTTIA